MTDNLVDRLFHGDIRIPGLLDQIRYLETRLIGLPDRITQTSGEHRAVLEAMLHEIDTQLIELKTTVNALSDTVVYDLTVADTVV